MTGGQSYTFRWQFTAMHATTDFKYYVTKAGWNQNHNLARSDLNLTPFLTVPYNGQRPPPPSRTAAPCRPGSADGM